MTFTSTPDARRRLLPLAILAAVVSAALAGPAPVAAVQTHTVSITPTTATAGVATAFTVSVNNNSTPPQTGLDCVRVAIPAGVTVSGTPTVTATNDSIAPGTARSWSAPTAVSGALQTIRTGAAANTIDPGGSVQVTFTATVASASTPVFTTTAYGQTNCSGQPFTISGSQPCVTVSAANAAPVLNAAGSPSLSSILEDAASNPGDAVSSLIASGGAGYITDTDAGALQGLALTGADSTNGAWQYTTDGGTNWINLGAVSDASARLLA